jgi:4-hydroxybenzoate polyprenyltransferase
MRLDRPVGTWLLLWPSLWALWIAGAARPKPRVLIIFVLGVVVMRAAGCVINDFADRDIDPYVRRTRDRPLAARLVTPVEALVLWSSPASARCSRCPIRSSSVSFPCRSSTSASPSAAGAC